MGGFHNAYIRNNTSKPIPNIGKGFIFRITKVIAKSTIVIEIIDNSNFFKMPPSSLLLILPHIVSYIMDFLKEIEEHFDKLSGRQLAAFYTKK